MSTDRRTFVVGAALTAVALPLATRGALAQDSTPVAQDSTPVGQDRLAAATRVRFVNADPNLAAIEIVVNNDKIEDQFTYGSASDWHDVQPGAVRLTIRADRRGFNFWVFDSLYPVLAGNDYQVVISPVVFTTIVDPGPIADGAAKVRVIHASVDTPAVDVAVAGGDVLIGDVGFGFISDYIEVPAGEYDLEVRPAGQTEVALPLTGVVVEAGTVYDFVAHGIPGDADAPLAVFTLTAAPTGAA